MDSTRTPVEGNPPERRLLTAGWRNPVELARVCDSLDLRYLDFGDRLAGTAAGYIRQCADAGTAPDLDECERLLTERAVPRSPGELYGILQDPVTPGDTLADIALEVQRGADERTSDLCRSLARDAFKAVSHAMNGSAPPTDSIPDDDPPLWLTPADLWNEKSYGQGLRTTMTGYHCLDSALRGGFRAECVYVIAGRTGNGKTSLASNIARRSALSENTILFFKLEESPRETLWRIHAAASQVDFRRLLDGKESTDLEERHKLADGWELVRELPLRLSARRQLDDIKRISRAHAEQGGGLIIVDQLSMISVGGANVGYERATIASNALRQLAVELHVPIVLVCQVNRAAAKDGEKPLTCHDLRDSGEIENDATAVLLIDKPRRAEQSWEAAPFMYLDITIGKHRYGPLSDPEKPLTLTWFPLICRVEESGK